MFSSKRVVTSPSTSSGAAPGNVVLMTRIGCSVSGLSSTDKNVAETYPKTMTSSTLTITVIGSLTEDSAMFIQVHFRRDSL